MLIAQENQLDHWLRGDLVEQRGIEPLTSALRTPRSPN